MRQAVQNMNRVVLFRQIKAVIPTLRGKQLYTYSNWLAIYRLWMYWCFVLVMGVVKGRDKLSPSNHSILIEEIDDKGMNLEMETHLN